MRAAPSPAQTSFGWAKRCSHELDGLLGLAWDRIYPLPGRRSWERNQQQPLGGSPVPGCGRTGAHAPPKQSPCFPKQDHFTLELRRHHVATGQRLINPSAAAGSKPRLFAVSCPRFIYYSYQAPDKNVMRALIFLRKHRKRPINDGTGENSLVIKLPEIIGMRCRKKKISPVVVLAWSLSLQMLVKDVVDLSLPAHSQGNGCPVVFSCIPGCFKCPCFPPPSC